eukprot:7469454-Pyramimonas_sp.AAC.1
MCFHASRASWGLLGAGGKPTAFPEYISQYRTGGPCWIPPRWPGHVKASGSAMPNTPLCGLDTQNHVVPSRDTHVRYPPGGLDALKHVVLARDNHVRYPPVWPGHVKHLVSTRDNH